MDINIGERCRIDSVVAIAVSPDVVSGEGREWLLEESVARLGLVTT